MPRRLLFIIVGPVLAGGLLAACGDDDTSTSTAPEAATAEVSIEGSRFLPKELDVAPGTEVSFENVDAFDHTVTSAEGSPMTFDSGLMGEGDVFAQTFDEPGTYDYFCEIHPTMRASVTVEG